MTSPNEAMDQALLELQLIHSMYPNQLRGLDPSVEKYLEESVDGLSADQNFQELQNLTSFDFIFAFSDVNIEINFRLRICTSLGLEAHLRFVDTNANMKRIQSDANEALARYLEEQIESRNILSVIQWVQERYHNVTTPTQVPDGTTTAECNTTDDDDASGSAALPVQAGKPDSLQRCPVLSRTTTQLIVQVFHQNNDGMNCAQFSFEFFPLWIHKALLLPREWTRLQQTSLSVVVVVMEIVWRR